MGGNVAFDKWLNDDGSENFKCRAWVNFNGVGVVAIRASGNVSSITDNGVGDYTVNFLEAMPDVNYCISGSGGALATNPSDYHIASHPVNASSARVKMITSATVGVDSAHVSVNITR